MDTSLIPVGLGAKRRVEDSRDWNLGSMGAQAQRPSAYFFDISKFQIEMQSKIGICGAEMGNGVQSLKKGMQGSPSVLWKEIKKIDGFKPTDGTDMRSVFLTLKNKGLAPRGTLNEDTTVDIATYTDPSGITPLVTAEEGINKISGFAFLPTVTFESLKQAIFANGVVGLLIDVGPEMWTDINGNISWAEKDILPMRIPSYIVSGHFVVAYGYDENFIYFINSWSKAWGRNGIGYFGSNYIPCVIEAGTVVEPTGNYVFQSDIHIGMTSSDVYFLQKRLNSDPRTQVAVSSGGSPGSETYFYGTLTEAAVRKYQTIHNIIDTGYCGPRTRASLNS